MQSRKAILPMLMYILVMSTLGTPQIVTQGRELNVPEKMVITGTLSPQFTNDIFVNLPSEFAPMTDFWSTNGPFSTRYFDGKSDYQISSYYPANDIFSYFNAGGILGYENKTSDDMEIAYRSEYYDLSNSLSENTTIENIPLVNNQDYMFRIEMKAGNPYALAYKLITSSTNVQMEFTITDPEGESYAQIRSSRPRVSDFLVMYPMLNGTYTMRITPTTENVILDTMEILTGLTISDIGKGYTEVFTGTSTTLKLFKVRNNVSSVTRTQLYETTYINNPIDNYDRPGDLLGDIEIRYFNRYEGIFGSTVGSETLQMGSDELLVSVIGFPPDENDPYVVGEKQRLGIPEGFNIEYSFWVENTPLQDLPVGVDFSLSSINDERYFLYTTGTPTAIGINMTYSGSATFTDVETGLPRSATSSVNDILNSITSDYLFVLEPGTYVVYISSSTYGGDSEARIYASPIADLNMDSTVTQSFDLMMPVFFKLPSSVPTRDFFNMTYVDHLNMSISFRVVRYNFYGINSGNGGYTFDQYANSTNLNYMVNNNSAYGTTNMYSGFGLDYSYVGFVVESNTLWNSTQDVPTVLETDNFDIKSRVQIQRYDYFLDQKVEDPDYDYRVEQLTGEYTRDLNSSKSVLMTVLYFTLDYGVYTFTVDTQNLSSSISLRTDMEEIWDTESEVTANISGIIHYIHRFTIASTEPTLFALPIITSFSGNTNGTLSVTMSSSVPHTLPDLQIGSLEAKVFEESVNTDIDIVTTTDTTPEDTSNNDLTVPLLIGGGSIILLGGVGGGIFYYLKKRKQKSPF